MKKSNKILIGFLSLLALSSCGADNSGVESLPGVDSSIDNGVVIETTRKVYCVVDYSINSKGESYNGFSFSFRVIYNAYYRINKN